MKNVTITLDEKVAHWARVEAAKSGMSLSRWIGTRLAADMAGAGDRTEQIVAMNAFLDGPGWPGIGKDLPQRDELHDRPALRRHEHPRLRNGSRRAGKTG
jgi:hypothetical protein